MRPWKFRYSIHALAVFVAVALCARPSFAINDVPPCVLGNEQANHMSPKFYEAEGLFEVLTTHPDLDTRKPESFRGTGFAVRIPHTGRAVILTASHLAGSDIRIRSSRGGDYRPATLLYRDADLDLAVLAASSPEMSSTPYAWDGNKIVFGAATARLASQLLVTHALTHISHALRYGFQEIGAWRIPWACWSFDANFEQGPGADRQKRSDFVFDWSGMFLRANVLLRDGHSGVPLVGARENDGEVLGILVQYKRLFRHSIFASQAAIRTVVQSFLTGAKEASATKWVVRRRALFRLLPSGLFETTSEENAAGTGVYADPDKGVYADPSAVLELLQPSKPVYSMQRGEERYYGFESRQGSTELILPPEVRTHFLSSRLSFGLQSQLIPIRDPGVLFDRLAARVGSRSMKGCMNASRRYLRAALRAQPEKIDISIEIKAGTDCGVSWAPFEKFPTANSSSKISDRIDVSVPRPRMEQDRRTFFPIIEAHGASGARYRLDLTALLYDDPFVFAEDPRGLRQAARIERGPKTIGILVFNGGIPDSGSVSIGR